MFNFGQNPLAGMLGGAVNLLGGGQPGGGYTPPMGVPGMGMGGQFPLVPQSINVNYRTAGFVLDGLNNGLSSLGGLFGGGRPSAPPQQPPVLTPYLPTSANNPGGPVVFNNIFGGGNSAIANGLGSAMGMGGMFNPQMMGMALMAMMMQQIAARSVHPAPAPVVRPAPPPPVAHPAPAPVVRPAPPPPSPNADILKMLADIQKQLKARQTDDQGAAEISTLVLSLMSDNNHTDNVDTASFHVAINELRDRLNNLQGSSDRIEGLIRNSVITMLTRSLANDESLKGQVGDLTNALMPKIMQLLDNTADLPTALVTIGDKLNTIIKDGKAQSEFSHQMYDSLSTLINNGNDVTQGLIVDAYNLLSGKLQDLSIGQTGIASNINQLLSNLDQLSKDNAADHQTLYDGLVTIFNELKAQQARIVINQTVNGDGNNSFTLNGDLIAQQLVLNNNGG